MNPAPRGSLAETLRASGTPFRVFIGWDKGEPEAYDVARSSLERHASIPVKITPIKLEARDLYSRGEDSLASTEFTYSRFLTPYLAGFQEWALFCDCDFLWLGDIAELLEFADETKALLAGSGLRGFVAGGRGQVKRRCKVNQFP